MPETVDFYSELTWLVTRKFYHVYLVLCIVLFVQYIWILPFLEHTVDKVSISWPLY